MIGGCMSAGWRQESALATLRACAPYAALGVVVAQLSATVLGASPELAISTAIRVAVGAWLLRMVLDVVRGRGGTPVQTFWGTPLTWRTVVIATVVLLA